MTENGDDHAGQTFDALIAPMKSVETLEPRDRMAAAFTLDLAWIAAAITGLLAVVSGLTLSLNLHEARGFGWPTSTPTDPTAQMNLDEALLALPIFGPLTVLLIAAFIPLMIYIARGRSPIAWIVPSTLVIVAAAAPIVSAFAS